MEYWNRQLSSNTIFKDLAKKIRTAGAPRNEDGLDHERTGCMVIAITAMVDHVAIPHLLFGYRCRLEALSKEWRKMLIQIQDLLYWTKNQRTRPLYIESLAAPYEISIEAAAKRRDRLLRKNEAKVAKMDRRARKSKARKKAKMERFREGQRMEADAAVHREKAAEYEKATAIVRMMGRTATETQTNGISTPITASDDTTPATSLRNDSIVREDEDKDEDKNEDKDGDKNEDKDEDKDEDMSVQELQKTLDDMLDERKEMGNKDKSRSGYPRGELESLISDLQMDLQALKDWEAQAIDNHC